MTMPSFPKDVEEQDNIYDIGQSRPAVTTADEASDQSRYDDPASSPPPAQSTVNPSAYHSELHNSWQDEGDITADDHCSVIVEAGDISTNFSPIGRQRRPSLSSSLYELVSEHGEPNSDNWESLEDEDLVQAQNDGKYSVASQAYFGSEYFPKRRKPGEHGPFYPRSVKAKGKQAAAALPADAAEPSTMASEGDYHGEEWQQAGEDATAQDIAGPGQFGRLECTVGEPRKENEATQNQYISYLVTTNTDFKSFQSSHITARRRFTDFVFLYKTLSREYPQCAVPPIPDKHKMEYVRGDRFGPDFTAKRAHSLERFLKRIALHPVLRRAVIFVLFLETNDWNATMKSRPTRGMSASEASSNSVLETWTDSFLNAFTKPHKSDRRFLEVKERADKLDDDLGTVSKTVARVARRESDLEADYADLATQFQKLAEMEPGVQNELTSFASSVTTTGQAWKGLREHTDQDYLGSIHDMRTYAGSMNALLKTREQKQLDFEALTEYQNKAVHERDSLASNANMGASGFIRAKIEDVRGVDHEASRRERQRKLEVQIRRLQDEVEGAKKTSEAFDEEVVKEVSDFERIKAVEFKETLTGLADANISFFKGTIETWEKFIEDMEREDRERARLREEGGT